MPAAFGPVPEGCFRGTLSELERKMNRYGGSMKIDVRTHPQAMVFVNQDGIIAVCGKTGQFTDVIGVCKLLSVPGAKR